MNLIDAGIKFTSVAAPMLAIGERITNKIYKVKNQETGEIYQTYPLINAIDIDWNGFKLSASDAVYNTTGELIALLDSINNKVISLDGTVQGQLIEITTNVENLQQTVTTHETKITALEDAIEHIETDVDPEQIRALIREILPSDFLTVTKLRTDSDLRDLIRGESAYEIAARIGGAGFPYHTEAEWLTSLHGTNGESAYEIAARLAGDSFIYENEQEWIDSLKAYSEEQLLTKQDKLVAGEGINIKETAGQQPVIEFSGWTYLKYI